MRQKAAITLTFIGAYAKTNVYAPEATVYLPARPRNIPTSCDIYCPTRNVCEKCWRGRCDYEGQDQLCFGCAEASCFNDRVLQGAGYKEAKQKSTTAAVAVAAAAALSQEADNSLEGYSRNSKVKAGIPKNKALVIIQNDKASRVIVNNDTVDFVGSKNFKSKKANSPVISFKPGVINLPPPNINEKKRIGHLPDIIPPVGAIVDQRVWIPVAVPEEVRKQPRTAQQLQKYHDDGLVKTTTTMLKQKILKTTTTTTTAEPVKDYPSADMLELFIPENLEGSANHVETQEVEDKPEDPILAESTNEDPEVMTADTAADEVYPVAIASIAERNNSVPLLGRRGGLVANLLRPQRP